MFNQDLKREYFSVQKPILSSREMDLFSPPGLGKTTRRDSGDDGL
jgi:hypothetical protein